MNQSPQPSLWVFFCLLIAMKRAGLHQTGAKALVRCENERPRKRDARSKTRRRGALSRALKGHAKGGKQKAPTRKCGQGRGAPPPWKDTGAAHRGMRKYLRAKYPLAGTAHARHRSKQTGSHGQAAFREIQCSPLPHQAARCTGCSGKCRNSSRAAS